MLSHVPGLQTYNSKQPFSQVNGIAVQIYRQASKLTTSPGSLRRHIKITCDYITLQIYMRPADAVGKNIRKVCGATCMTLRISCGGNTFADEGNGLFVFQSGGIFVQAFCFPFFAPRLFFQLHLAFDGSFVLFNIFFHLSDFGVVSVLFK